MPKLPNPFAFVPVEPSVTDKAAASTPLVSTSDAAADRFVLDERTFMEALEPAPAFLAAPRPDYLKIVEVLEGY